MSARAPAPRVWRPSLLLRSRRLRHRQGFLRPSVGRMGPGCGFTCGVLAGLQTFSYLSSTFILHTDVVITVLIPFYGMFSAFMMDRRSVLVMVSIPCNYLLGTREIERVALAVISIPYNNIASTPLTDTIVLSTLSIPYNGMKYTLSIAIIILSTLSLAYKLNSSTLSMKIHMLTLPPILPNNSPPTPPTNHPHHFPTLTTLRTASSTSKAQIILRTSSSISPSIELPTAFQKKDL